MLIHLPLPIEGSFPNTVGRPSGSSRVTSSPAGLWCMSTRGRGSAKRTLTTSPLMRTSSPGPTFWPTSAGIRLTVMRPARISSSIARREPKPQLASTLCRRCGSLKISSVDRLCFGGGKLSAIRCSARFGCSIGPGTRGRECVWRLGGLGGDIRHLQEVGGIELGERRQLRDRGEAKIVEKRFRRRVKRGTARRFAMANRFDPLPVLERLDDVRRHGDAADRFDIAAGDRLLISDDRERFHHRARIAGRLLRGEPIEKRLHVAPPLKAPARRDLDQFHLARGPILHERVEERTDGIGIERWLEELRQLRCRHRFAGDEQRRFEHTLLFVRFRHRWAGSSIYQRAIAGKIVAPTRYPRRARTALRCATARKQARTARPAKG